MSPNRWMMPTNNSATGRGNKSATTGTMMVDVPKPDSAPTPEATSVNSASKATSAIAGPDKVRSAGCRLQA